MAGTIGDGWISLGLFAIALILGLLGDRSRPAGSGSRMGIVIIGLLTAAYGVWKMMDFNKAFSAAGEMPGGMADSFSIGIGVYLVMVAGFLLLILPFLLGSRDVVTPVAPSPA